MSIPIFTSVSSLSLLQFHQIFQKMKTILICITLFIVTVSDARNINLKSIDQDTDSLATREQILFHDWMTWMVSTCTKIIQNNVLKF